ncbi:MAG: hypothetical protein Q4F82_12105 [bacterium]|nr:hypothetical protein [bacterium]
MTNKTSRNIKICSYVALAFCVVWAVSDIANFVAFIFGGNASSHSIDWSQKTVLKVAILSCYVVGMVSIIGLCVKAIFNISKGLRDNTAFPRSNERLLFWMALADFIYVIGSCNLQVLWDDSILFLLQHTNFVTPFFLLFFAFMYKVAADAVEENNLTV